MKYRTGKLIYNTTVVVLIICGIIWVSSRFVHLGRVEYTDNAQVKQLIVPVNSRVQGFVQRICFDEYQTVHKGDTLALIEDTEFRYRLAQAEADYSNALSGNSVMATSITTADNNISVSDAASTRRVSAWTMPNANTDATRTFSSQEAVTRQQYDAMKTNYDALKARYELLLRQRRSTSLMKQEQAQRLDQTEAGIKLAEAGPRPCPFEPFVHRYTCTV